MLESLFLDKNSNQIDSLILNLIIFILCHGSSIGWVMVAVADAGGWTAGFAATAAAYVAAVEVAVVAAPFGGWDFGRGLTTVLLPPTGGRRGGGATPPPPTTLCSHSMA